jgi:hypothetical protein
MSYFRTVLRRLAPRKSSPPRAVSIETLEDRRLMTASPVVTALHFTGTVNAVTSMTLTFDEPLDPTSAQDLKSYEIGKVIPATSADSGITLGDILGFLAQPKLQPVKNGKVQFTSAAYDATADTVTLTPVAPWNAQQTFRVLRVYGTGAHVIQDMSGDPLNGGANTYVHWTVRTGKTIAYYDSNGDRVTITLKGKGQIVAFLQTNADHAPMIFIKNGSSTSVLDGKVRQSKTGDGVAVIPELEGVSTIQASLLNNPEFEVLSTEP